MRLIYLESDWQAMKPVIFSVLFCELVVGPYVFFILTGKPPTVLNVFKTLSCWRSIKLIKKHNFDTRSFNDLHIIFVEKKKNNFDTYRDL